VTAFPRRVGWVWQDGPPPSWPAGLDAVLVRAANGAGHTGSGGYDYRASYRAWRRAYGARVLPWTWVGPPAFGDGAGCADAIATAAADGHPVALYVADIETAVPAGQVTAFRRRLAELDPAAAVGFSSYPTRAQAVAQGVPWDECLAAFDVALPQVYWPYQRQRLDQIRADHANLPLHIAVSPTDDPQWTDTARYGLTRGAGVSLWRYGLPGFTTWAAGAADLDQGSSIVLDQPTADQVANIVRHVLEERRTAGHQTPYEALDTVITIRDTADAIETAVTNLSAGGATLDPAAIAKAIVHELLKLAAAAGG
jgi:hypothetical protein